LHVDCDWEYEYKMDFYSDSWSLVGKSNYLKMIEERVNKKGDFTKRYIDNNKFIYASVFYQKTN
jgi:hypothetical protein